MAYSSRDRDFSSRAREHDHSFEYPRGHDNWDLEREKEYFRDRDKKIYHEKGHSSSDHVSKSRPTLANNRGSFVNVSSSYTSRANVSSQNYEQNFSTSQSRPSMKPSSDTTAQPNNTFRASEQATQEELPPGWKSASDPQGRIYYYHSQHRIPQWNRPEWSKRNASTHRGSTNSFATISPAASVMPNDDNTNLICINKDNTSVYNNNTIANDNNSVTKRHEMHLPSFWDNSKVSYVSNSNNKNNLNNLNNNMNNNGSYNNTSNAAFAASFNNQQPQFIEIGGVKVEVPPLGGSHVVEANQQKVESSAVEKETVPSAAHPDNSKIEFIDAKRKLPVEYRNEISNCVRKCLEKYYDERCKVGRITSKEDF
ncbi:uncharacterized protein DDB_G0283697-like [Zophobas morio]|uniref:uncharacterized protein DDB_G0283697-like n=1 Tax=Zophobas morio TaxID=2755281 RepID=UPI003082CDC2